jgi:UDPglucose--hexose-1-phosphate uridylyltransferase
MDKFVMEDHPHRRYNILTGEWVLVSPHRAKRPWQGQTEKLAAEQRPGYDPACYLCPGNERAGGIKNPPYKDPFSFVNDFSSLLADSPEGEYKDEGLLIAKSERGFCKVLCFSPRHDLTIPEMDLGDIKKVVDLWQKEYIELSKMPLINYVQIFENKGSIMGCSNPHPHGQIWSQESVPVEPAKESVQQEIYFRKNSKSLLSSYMQIELDKKIRILAENKEFIAVAPFWGIWPFESMIISRRHFQNIAQMSESEKTGLADIYRQITIMYDNLFEISFPYSAGIHQSPTDGNDHPHWHFHMHFYPPLLRSATVKKFMVGYEMLGNPQRDITPETSAEKLRSLSKIHYKNR